jgi:aspartyl aminopeptidase
LKSVCSVEESDKITVAVWFDSEEIGSKSLNGADSVFLKDILERIVYLLTEDKENCYIAFANSFIISADGVHAIHPNFSDKHDKNYTPEINKGITLKFNANQRYSTTSETASFIMKLCDKINISYQKIYNRSDLPSGSTIGPLSAANTGIKTVDLGIPMLSMHSVRELAGLNDMKDILKLFENFWREG